MYTRTLALLLAVGLTSCTSDRATAPSPAEGSSRAIAATWPDVISLPNGFSPEGIASGRGSTLYVGSLATGQIFQADARTGAGSVLVPTQPDRAAAGVKFDASTDRLFVAGGFTGQAYVYDASTGATLAVYQLSDPTTGPTFINDVAVVGDAAYFTDDSRPVLYRIQLGAGRTLPPADAVQVIPYTGDFQFVPDAINANGIVATPGDRWLIIVNTTTGTLYRVDGVTGASTAILPMGVVPGGDGLVLIGHTLYVVQGPLDQIAVLRLNSSFTSAELQGTLTNGSLDFPSTIAAFGHSLYAVNARFEVAPGPDVAFQAVRVSR